MTGDHMKASLPLMKVLEDFRTDMMREINDLINEAVEDARDLDNDGWRFVNIEHWEPK
jgi:hypothetical protein